MNAVKITPRLVLRSKTGGVNTGKKLRALIRGDSLQSISMRISKLQKKEKLQLILTGFLVLVLVFYVINGVKRVKKYMVKFTKIKETVIKQQIKEESGKNKQEDGQGAALFTQLEEETAKMGFNRDPFFAVPVEIPIVVPVLVLKLKGIVWDSKLPRTIINDIILSEGDKIGDYTVLRIEPDRVILNDGVNDLELNLDNIE